MNERPDHHRYGGEIPVMAKRAFQDYVCRPYCMFFTPGRKEDLACRGAEVAELLVNRGSVDPAVIQAPRKEAAVWERHRDALGPRICRLCPFFPNDCDFQGEEQAEGAEPCGGFILLSLWYERGLIRMIDLE